VARLSTSRPDLGIDAAARQRPERVIISLPLHAERKELSHQERYDAFRRKFGDAFPRPLPETIGHCQFLYFDADWTPRLLGVRGTAFPMARASPRTLRRLAREFKITWGPRCGCVGSHTWSRSLRWPGPWKVGRQARHDDVRLHEHRSRASRLQDQPLHGARTRRGRNEGRLHRPLTVEDQVRDMHRGGDRRFDRRTLVALGRARSSCSQARSHRAGDRCTQCGGSRAGAASRSEPLRTRAHPRCARNGASACTAQARRSRCPRTGCRHLRPPCVHCSGETA
jgi:hypothetical protein